MAVLTLAALPACGTSGGADVAAPAVLNQVILFDAGGGAGDGLLLPVTASGVLVDTGPGGPECPPAAYLAPGGLLVFDPSSFGRSWFSASLGPAFTRTATTPAPADPTILDGVKDDCDLLEVFDDVQTYVDALIAEARRIVDDQEICAATADVLYCDLIRMVEAATTLDDFTVRQPVEIFGRNFGGGQIGSVPRATLSPCANFYVALRGLSQTVGNLRFEAARCEDARDSLKDVIDRTGSALSQGQKEVRRAAGASYRRDAHEAHGGGLELLRAIEEVKATLVRADVEASCDRCTPDSRVEMFPAAGAVVSRYQWDPLEAVVAALERAQQASDDPDEADRLEELAARLYQVPGHRVMHVSYPSTVGLGRVAVAMADPFALDDGVTALVVVLRELPENADRQKPNAADLDLLHMGWRVFARVLTSGQ